MHENTAQVIPMLIRGGHRRDYLIMNFGLHFSEDYKGDLQTIIEQVQARAVHAPLTCGAQGTEVGLQHRSTCSRTHLVLRVLRRGLVEYGHCVV